MSPAKNLSPMTPSAPSAGSAATLQAELTTMASMGNYHRWIFEEVHPFLGMRIAEIGGGLGTFSQEIIEGHVRLHAESSLDVFEPAVDLHSHLRQRFLTSHADLMAARRLAAVTGYFSASANRYDSVVMVNVLEHIQQEDGLLADIHEALTTDGTIIVVVPALSWLYSRFDRAVGHVRRYEKRPLCALLSKHGFKIVKAQYMDVVGAVGWYVVNVLAQSRSLNCSLAAFYDRCGIPLTRRLEHLCRPPIGKTLLVVGKKSMAGTFDLRLAASPRSCETDTHDDRGHL